jgi:hypothetical protein
MPPVISVSAPYPGSFMTAATMSPPEIVDGIACFRVVGTCRLPLAVGFVASAIDQALTGRHYGCLVDASLLDGFGSPSVATRHQVVRSWAECAQGRVALALVLQSAVIDPEKIGVIAGRNHGLQCDVFDDVNEAWAWLLDIGPARQG